MSDELTEWFETADAVIVAARVLNEEVRIAPNAPQRVKDANEKLTEALDALAARDAADDDDFDLGEAAPYFDDSMPGSWTEAQADEFEAYTDEFHD